MPSSSPVICVEGLSFAYDTLPVLEGISFTLNAGEFAVIFGPNGGGKTTLIQLLLGFLKPQKGKIALWGAKPKTGRHKIGWVPQLFHFDPHFPISVIEVVLGGLLGQLPWWGHFSAQHYQQAEAQLAAVGLKHYSTHPFSSLSGGQRQRVLLARALVSRPQVLFLDEPTASVDPHAQAEIYTLLQTLRGKVTVVMVTHQLHAAVQQADRLLCIEKTLTCHTSQTVCEHFALGLYHPPLSEKAKAPFKKGP